LSFAAAKLLHHPLHLTKLGKELSDFLAATAASSRDTPFAAGV
jgi:hypothetical protein